MIEKIDITQLTLGMFVTELDRPWADTPFPLQGFLIDSQEQIQQLHQHCKFVYVDRHRSVGDAYRAREERTAERQQRGALRSPTAQPAADGSTDEQQPMGLLASLNAIWAAAFRVSSSASNSDATESRDQRVAAAEGAASRSYMEYVRSKKRDGRGITEAELGHLIAVSSSRASGRELGSGSRQLTLVAWVRKLFALRSGTKDGASAPEAGSPDVQDEPPVYPDRTTFEEELLKAAEVHKRSEEVISTIIQDIRDNKPLAIEKAEDAVAWMVESVVRNPNSLIWLARLKSHNHHTYDHALNVSVYLLSFGRHLGLPKIYLQLLGTAGLMQDLGKVKILPQLLDKRTALTAAECEVLKAHVDHSIEILQDSPDVSPMLLEIVAQHHERHDGSGYPKGLKGDQISMFGAMAGIVDTFVGMTSDRPYGEATSPEQALQQLYEWRGKIFSAEIVEDFIKCVGVFQVGSLVELNTGEVAVIVAHNRARRLLPRIMLILDWMKKPYARPIMLDLINAPPTPGGEQYRIVRSLQHGAHGIDLSALSFAQQG